VTVTLGRGLVAADAGQVADGEAVRPDPEVPERARRRTFTAKYKLEVLAAYEAAEPVRRARSCAGRAFTPATLWSGGGPAMPGRWRAWPGRGGRPGPDPRDAQIAALREETARLEQELAKARFVVEVQAKLQAYAGDRCQVPVSLSVARIFR
jgi:hypothetical protein